MNTDVFPNYAICRMSDKDNIIALDVEQYENMLGMLSFLHQTYDVHVDVKSVKNDDDNRISVYIDHIIRVY